MTTLAQSVTRAPSRSRIGLIRYWQLYRQRARLADLDAGALRDIGLTRADAQTEARRAVWDAPDHWIG